MSEPETSTAEPQADLRDYAIVIPVYYNEGTLAATFESLDRDVIARNPDRTAEIVFVDDGSGDGSWQELVEVQRQRPELVRLIKLTRNFGQPAARLAGLRAARARCAITLSADLQDPAGLIDEMLRAHFDEGHEVVIGVRAARQESRYRIWTSGLFYGLMRRLRFHDMPVGGFDFVLLGRRALDAVLRNSEANSFFQGQVLWTGFRPRTIEYTRGARGAGSSRWTLGKKVKLVIDAVMSYSYAPVRWISLIGIAFALFGLLAAGGLTVRRFVVGTAVEGWTALIVVVLITSGVQMLMLGVLGEYLWRTLAQARGRDSYVIETVKEGCPPDAPAAER